MQAPNMLYIQETKSVNTTRVFRLNSLPEALDVLVKIFAEIKFKKNNSEEVTFDLQEALDYYEDEYELKFFEELPSNPERSQGVDGFQVKNVKVYNGKMLLDELVDYLSTEVKQDHNPEMKNK